MAEREVHPAAALFPLIEGQEFGLLVTSIKERGLDNPIVLDSQDRILDGRNRLRACEVAGVEPLFTHYGGSDPVDFVRRANLRRRDLTPSQKAAIEVDLSAMTAKAEAKERQREAGQSFGRGSPEKVILPGGEAIGRTASQEMAERAGVGHATIERVQRVKAEAPELFDKIKAGEVTAKAAERQIAQSKIMPAPEGRTKAVLAERVELARTMAASGHTSDQIAARLEIGVQAVKDLCGRHDINITADAVVGKRRRVDSNRIIEETVGALDGLRMGVELVNYDDVDHTCIPQWIDSIGHSLRFLNQMLSQLKKLKEPSRAAAQ